MELWYLLNNFIVKNVKENKTMKCNICKTNDDFIIVQLNIFNLSGDSYSLEKNIQDANNV